MQPHPLRGMFADHSCKNCRYPERGCARYMRLVTCQEFQPNDDAIFREIVRLKIAHLRRMAERADCLRSGWTKMAGFAWASRRAAALDRFCSACLAKITELKELQCSTKP